MMIVKYYTSAGVPVRVKTRPAWRPNFPSDCLPKTPTVAMADRKALRAGLTRSKPQ